jgi:hypothetical protein
MKTSGIIFRVTHCRSQELFVQALEGMGDPKHYFNRIKLDLVIENLQQWYLMPAFCD